MSKHVVNQKIISGQLENLKIFSGKKIVVEQVKSTIRTLPVHKVNIKALGLNGIGQKMEHTLSPQISGMLRKVIHLVKISEAS